MKRFIVLTAATALTQCLLATPASANVGLTGSWALWKMGSINATHHDDGGVWCTTTSGVIRGRLVIYKLRNDRSTRYDFYGYVYRSVAEVSGDSNCNDFIRGASQSLSVSGTGAAWVDQDPISDFSGACRTVTFSVAYQGAGISAPSRRCDHYDVYGAMARASTRWGMNYGYNGNKNAHSRELAQVGILRIAQGVTPRTNLAVAIGVGNSRV